MVAVCVVMPVFEDTKCNMQDPCDYTDWPLRNTFQTR